MRRIMRFNNVINEYLTSVLSLINDYVFIYPNLLGVNIYKIKNYYIYIYNKINSIKELNF